MGNLFSRTTNIFNGSVQADNFHGGVGDNIQRTSGKEEKSINQGSNHASRGAAAYDGTAQYAGGDVHGNLVAGDYIKNYYGHEEPGKTINRNVKQISSKKFKGLKKFLTERAKKNNKWEDTTSTTNSAYAPLQITQYQQKDNPDEHGHLQSRDEIINSYNDSSLDYLQPEDFFEKSKTFVCNSPEYKRCLTKKAKQECLSELANVIGVVGQPGVGKSTLTKVLLSRIVSKKRLYKADYIFYVKLRDLYSKTEMNLLQFLMGEEVCSSLDWMNDEEIRNEVLKLLCESKSVCILLDGLDEVGITISETEKFKVNIFGNELPQKFILGLLSGQILPGAKKIFTSRPGQMLCLPENFRPKFLVQILGITSDGINKICENLCGDKSSRVLAYVKNQPDLYSFIKIPIHCVLITNCIFETLINTKIESVPNSITDVFLLSHILFAKTEHIRENLNKFDITNISDLQKICSLAWSAVKKRQFYFGDKELSKFDLNLESISSFTATVKRLNQENRILMLQRATSNCTYFTHLLIQEFFAAIHCLFFMNEETFEETFSFASGESEGILNNHYAMVVKFMFGLSNAETFKIFQSIYPKIVEPIEHQNLLKQYVIDTANDRCCTYFLCKKGVSICSLAYELRNESFAKEIVDFFPDVEVSYCITLQDSFLPSDILSFFYVLKYLNESLSLSISCEFNGNAIELFIKEMKALMKQSNHIKFCFSRLKCPSEFYDIALNELLLMKENPQIDIHRIKERSRFLFHTRLLRS